MLALPYNMEVQSMVLFGLSYVLLVVALVAWNHGAHKNKIRGVDDYEGP